jgi:hypothetical protein
LQQKNIAAPGKWSRIVVTAITLERKDSKMGDVELSIRVGGRVITITGYAGLDELDRIIYAVKSEIAKGEQTIDYGDYKESFDLSYGETLLKRKDK